MMCIEHEHVYFQDKNIISLIYNDQPPATENQPDLLQSVADMYSKSKRGNYSTKYLLMYT